MPRDHHHHDHAGHTHAAPDVSGSLLRASAASRLGVAAALVALIWGGVFWAVS